MPNVLAFFCVACPLHTTPDQLGHSRTLPSPFQSRRVARRRERDMPRRPKEWLRPPQPVQPRRSGGEGEEGEGEPRGAGPLHRGEVEAASVIRAPEDAVYHQARQARGRRRRRRWRRVGRRGTRKRPSGFRSASASSAERRRRLRPSGGGQRRRHQHQRGRSPHQVRRLGGRTTVLRSLPRCRPKRRQQKVGHGCGLPTRAVHRRGGGLSSKLNAVAP